MQSDHDQALHQPDRRADADHHQQCRLRPPPGAARSRRAAATATAPTARFGAPARRATALRRGDERRGRCRVSSVRRPPPPKSAELGPVEQVADARRRPAPAPAPTGRARASGPGPVRRRRDRRRRSRGSAAWSERRDRTAWCRRSVRRRPAARASPRRSRCASRKSGSMTEALAVGSATGRRIARLRAVLERHRVPQSLRVAPYPAAPGRTKVPGSTTRRTTGSFQGARRLRAGSRPPSAPVSADRSWSSSSGGFGTRQARSSSSAAATRASAPTSAGDRRAPGSASATFSRAALGQRPRRHAAVRAGEDRAGQRGRLGQHDEPRHQQRIHPAGPGPLLDPGPGVVGRDRPRPRPAPARVRPGSQLTLGMSPK